MTEIESYDYIIVGAGSAGCVLANRLSEDRAVKVCVVEAGPVDKAIILKVPAGVLATQTHPVLNWRYYSEAQKQLDGRRIYWPRGRVLGGSSSINGMLYVRGHRQDYDDWAQMGCAGWSYDDVLPLFKRAEGYAKGGDDFHGADGPLKVGRGTGGGVISDAFLEAASSAGFPINPGFNGAEQAGFGFFDTTVFRGRRCSAAKAFLEPARDRPNLTILTDTLTQRVIVEHGRAIGIEISQGNTKRIIHAEREIVLSGGSINSPQILLLSGIGPADELHALDIPVKVDSPMVGKNLRDHLAYAMAIECPLPVTAYRYMKPWIGGAAAVQYLFKRSGVFAETPIPLGGFFGSEPGIEVPDMQLQITAGVVARDGSNKPDRHAFGVYINPGRPQSVGEIRLRSTDPSEPPIIDPRYMTAEHDWTLMRRGVERIADILDQPALRPYVDPVSRAIYRPTSAAALDADIRQKTNSTYHPIGTCAMGVQDSAVVDPCLRVRGVAGLRVADASVMPTLINGNTNAPAIMVGEKASQLIMAN